MMPDPIINTAAPRQIPVARPSLGPAEAAAVRDAILSGWASGGPQVTAFEQHFAASHGLRHGVACNSGTTALHLALAALNVRPGDRVAIPTLTMVAVANAVLYCGATPVFVDSEPETGNPDPKALERCEIYGRTKAFIVPHLYGVAAAEFIAACNRQAPGAPIIEDCAEAHYAHVDGRPVGTLGHIACFSFYGNKIITTGEGGMVLTDDERCAERLRSLRAHAFTPGNHFDHQELAYGYRMTEMQGALGLVQHNRRFELLARRAEIAAQYTARLSGRCNFKLPARPAGSVWWIFPLLAASETMRDRARAALAAAGVETRSYFRPLHVQSHLRRYAEHECPVADYLARRGFYLPLFFDLTDDDVSYICDVLERL